MKKMSKLVSLALAGVMVASAFAGCGGKKEPAATNKTAGTASTQTATGDKSWEKDKSPITIDWFTNLSYSYVWDENAPVYKKITEDTGVKINYIHSVGAKDEKFNTMIAANSLPDVITVEQNSTQRQELETSGRLHSLNKLAEKDAPAYNKNMPKSMLNWWKNEDGNIYVYPSYFWAPEKITKDTVIETNTAMFARKDIMDKLDIKADDFKTQDGMVAALKKVKDANIQYNGQTVTPLYFSPEGGVDYTLPTALTNMFAIPREDKNGNFLERKFTKENEEVISFANRLYREGLLSKENFTAQKKQIQEKYQAGSIFCMITNVSDIRGQMRELNKADKNAVTVAVGPVMSKSGRQPTLNSTSMTAWTLTSITKNAKKPERIIQFFDYMTREENLIMQEFGFEGVHHTKGGENGKLKWTEKFLEEKTKDDNKAKQTTGVGAIYWFIDPVLRDKLLPAPQNDQEKMTDAIKVYFSKYVYPDTAFGNLGPKGGTDESIKNKEIEDYNRREIVKAVLAENEQKALEIYNNILKEVDKMGDASVRKVQNEAFQANKKKTGEQFAWPGNKK